MSEDIYAALGQSIDNSITWVIGFHIWYISWAHCGRPIKRQIFPMTRESSNFQKFHCVLFKGLGIDTELGFIVVLWFLSTWSWRTAACDSVMWFVILWFVMWFCDLWFVRWFVILWFADLVVEDCSMLASAGGHFLLLAAKIKDFMRKIVSGYFARKLILRKINQHCWWERYYFQ